MKTLLYFLCYFVARLAFASEDVQMPTAMLTLHAVDEAAAPLKGVPAGIRAKDEDVRYRIGGKTDRNGNFSAALPAFGYLNYSAGGGDYYSYWGQYSFNPGAAKGKPSEWQKRRWEPWNPTVILTVVKRGPGKPMYAKRLSTVSFPDSAIQQPMGYDLEVGDWTAPMGNGKVVDVLFGISCKFRMGKYTITCAFPGTGNGVLTVTTRSNSYSEFESPRVAAESGYRERIQFDENVRPVDLDPEERINCLVFRVRSVVDADGRVISARYGKIYPERLNLVHYLNTDDNDRHLEFDVRRNLLKFEKRLGLVTRP